MKLTNMRFWKNHSEIEQQLLSNETSPEAQRETELLFGALRHARNEHRELTTLSTLSVPNSLKGIVMGLLYAGGLLGRTAQAPGVRTSITDDAAAPGGLANPATASAAEYGPYSAWSNPQGEVENLGAAITVDTVAGPYRARRETERQSAAAQPKLERQNDSIAHLLNLTMPTGNGLENNTFGPVEPLLLVDRAARSLILRPERLAKMAFTVLQDSGLYGANPGERLTENVMHKIVNDWIMENLFGFTVDIFVARQMLSFISALGVSPDKGANLFDNKACREMILKTLSPLEALALEANETNDWVYQYVLSKVVAPVLPSLFFKGADSLAMGTLDWCYLHIGLSVAAKIAVDISDLTQNDVIDLGCSFSAMLMMGLLSPGLIELFTYPALLHYQQSMSDEDKRAVINGDWHAHGVRQNALKHFFSASEAREYKVNPFKRFSSAMLGYKSRTELAKKILTEHCGELSSQEYTDRVEAYKSNPKNYQCSPDKMDPGGNKPDRAGTLPDLNQTFETQNQAITEIFAVIDRFMITDILEQMAEEDRQFLRASTVRRAGADFSRLDKLTGLPEEYFITGARAAVQLLPDIDLLLAANGEEEHIFALGRDKSGYWLKRIDRLQENYYPLMEKNLAGQDQSYRLNIFSGEGSQGRYKPAGAELDVLIATLTAQHTKILASQLYAQGYEETTREAVNRFLLSFIPFYHCAAWDPHRREEALISCVTDSFNLLPLAGQAAMQSSRILLKAGLGSAASLRTGAASYATGSTLRSALSIGLRTFVNLALVPAAEELDRKALTGLLYELARAFDPGIGLVGTLGREMVGMLRSAARLWRSSSPAMEKLFLRMDNDALGNKFPSGVKEYETHRLAGIDHDIPVVLLGGDRYLQRPVLVRINPHTGDIFGKKYILSEDNLLVSIPLPAAIRLKNILQVGLSGRGAGLAAKVWNRQYSVDDIVARELNGVACTAHISRYGEPGAEDLLFPEHGISLAQQSLNIGAYERVYRALPARERMAMRFWTRHNDDSLIFNEGPITVELRGVMPSKNRINENLWQDIPLESWSMSDKHNYFYMVDLLKRPFPKQSGSYLGVGQYPLLKDIPWGDSIGPGDIVTNYPTFMSVFPSDHYAKIFTAQADRDAILGKKFRQAMVYFKIEGGQRCVPLISDIATGAAGKSASTIAESDVNLREYVYPPNTFFRVKSIATAYMIEGEMHPAQRIGVVLEELIGPVNEAKNIYTGEWVPVTSSEWANRVERYHEALFPL